MTPQALLSPSAHTITPAMLEAARQALASGPAPSGMSREDWEAHVGRLPLAEALTSALLMTPQAGPQLTTPCHGEPLVIYTRTDGDRELPDEIACPRDRCLNSWNPDGTIHHLSLPETLA